MAKLVKNISLSIIEGRTVRDLLYNDLLIHLNKKNIEPTIFSEASNIPEFTGQWNNQKAKFVDLEPSSTSTNRSRAYWMRRRISKLKTTGILEAYIHYENKFLYPPKKTYLDQFESDNCQLLVTTHAHLPNERELISSADKLNIPTLGLIKSWDNVHKGIYSRPKSMAVWNKINKQELVDIEKYKPENIFVIGAPQFDSYFDKNIIWSKTEYLSKLGLNPNRPIIFYATIGDFGFNLDETYWLDFLLTEIKNGTIKNNPQIICRLHPWSRYERFKKYENIEGVKISYVKNYWPGLGWYMDNDEVTMMANMINHSNIVISPGSTVILEAAIFNRPTIFPIFNDIQKQRADQYFNTWVLGKHFERIKNLDLVPIIDNSKLLAPAINKYMENPSWYEKQRSRLVSDYVCFTDGKSTIRLANLIEKLSGIKIV